MGLMHLKFIWFSHGKMKNRPASIHLFDPLINHAKKQRTFHFISFKQYPIQRGMTFKGPCWPTFASWKVYRGQKVNNFFNGIMDIKIKKFLIIQRLFFLYSKFSRVPFPFEIFLIHEPWFFFFFQKSPLKSPEDNYPCIIHMTKTN